MEDTKTKYRFPDLNQFCRNGRGRGETQDGSLPTLTTSSGRIWSQVRCVKVCGSIVVQYVLFEKNLQSTRISGIGLFLQCELILKFVSAIKSWIWSYRCEILKSGNTNNSRSICWCSHVPVPARPTDVSWSPSKHCLPMSCQWPSSKLRIAARPCFSLAKHVGHLKSEWQGMQCRSLA